MEPALDSYFFPGGTLPDNVLSYVERTADKELLGALLAGEFCYVLDTRQVGKSSLMVRAARHLHTAGLYCAILDLSSIGENLTQEQWYFGMLSDLAVCFRQETQVEEYWIQHPELSDVKRWFAVLRNVILPHMDAPLMIFVDEIDAVRKLPFSADEFLAAIRECYNRRISYPDKHSITFCLIGVATPSDLIQDVRTTPFNIGRRIELHDFSLSEATCLADGLPGSRTERQAQIERIWYWTAGHPYLTQKFCQAVARQRRSLSPREIDILCHTIFLCRQAREEEDNLKFVSRQVLSEEATRPDILLLYGRLLAGRRLDPHDAPEALVNRLLLAGLVRSTRGTGHLVIRNRIYAHAFDGAWVRANMPNAEVRRQQAAVRLAVARATGVLACFIGLACMAIYQTNRAASKSVEAQKAKFDLALLEKRTGVVRGELTVLTEDLKTVKTKLGDAQSNTQRLKEKKTALESKKSALEVTLGRQNSDLKTVSHSLAMQQARLNRAKLDNQRLIHDANRMMGPLTMAGYGSELDTLQFGLNNVTSYSEQHRLPSRDAMQVLVDAVCAGIVRRLRMVHPGGVCDAAVSPDNSRLVTGGVGRYAYVWDVVSGKVVQRLEVLPATAPQKVIDNAFYSKDGKWIVTSSEDYRVCIWDAHNHAALQTRPLADIAVGPTAFTMAALSQDGRRLVTTASLNRVTVWELAASSDRSELTCHRLIDLKGSPESNPNSQSMVCAVDISPDGKYVTAGGKDQTLRIWNVDTGQIFATKEKAHASTIHTVRFAPWGTDVISGGEDSQAFFWSLDKDKNPAMDYPGHLDALNDVEIGGAQLYVCTAGNDRRVRIWSFHSGKLPLYVLNTHTDIVQAARFSDDTRSLVTASKDHTAELWQLTIPMFSGSNGPAHCVAFSPNGQSVLCCREDGLATVWDWRTGEHLWHFFSGGDKTQSARCTHAVFSHDGQWVATACEDGSVGLWKPERATKYNWVDNPTRVLQGRTGKPVSTVAYSPDDRWVLTAGGDGTAVLWNTRTGKQDHVFHDPSHSVLSAFFAPDGQSIVTTSQDGSVRLWDINADSPRRTLLPPGRQERSKEDTNHPLCAVFSPDGRYVLSADQDHSAHLWEANTGKYVRALEGHGAAVTVAVFSPDGNSIATGSLDRTVRLWDTTEVLSQKTLLPLYALRNHASDVEWLDFSPDGNWIATASLDGTCRIYPATFEGMVKKARELARTRYKESKTP